MYIDDGSADESAELNLDVDGDAEHDGLDFESDAIGLVDSVDEHFFGGAPHVVVDTADGPVVVGEATIDTNDDGRMDTAVVHDAQGDTVLYTDADGNDIADVATELSPDGEVVIADHTDDGWMQAQHGHLTADGQYQIDDRGQHPFTPPVGDDTPSVRDTADDRHWRGWAGALTEAGSAPGVVRIDATTGQWISQN
ncbi:MAG TPA: hypothetical protein VJX10_02450 [Pseudonocardiaceae bacterium]|nr:hypothetical protein [Pseudonocardiaceae bacterium]